MIPIKILLHYLEGYEVTFGYLIDDENTIIFHNNQVWLGRVKASNNEIFEVRDPLSLLGEQKQVPDLEEYAKSIVKHLKNTSLFSYIIQKHFYSDQDINFDVSNI